MHASGSHAVEQLGFAIFGWRDLYETRQPYSFSGFHRLEASAFLGIADRNHPGSAAAGDRQMSRTPPALATHSENRRILGGGLSVGLLAIVMTAPRFGRDLVLTLS